MRLRMSVIMRCADLESSWVSVNDVRPWISVAPTTARISQPRNCIWRLPITLSTRNLVEAGSTRPLTRLIAMRPKPRSSMPLRGSRSAQTSGRDFQVSAADFLRLPPALDATAAARDCVLSPAIRVVGLPGSLGTMFFRCRDVRYDYRRGRPEWGAFCRTNAPVFWRVQNLKGLAPPAREALRSRSPLRKNRDATVGDY